MANKDGRPPRPVVCVETGRVYESIAQAALAMGITASTLNNTLRGKYETSAGYHWEYAQPDVTSYPPRVVTAERVETKPKKVKPHKLHHGTSMTIEEVQKEAARRTKETGRYTRYADIQKEETVAMIRERDRLQKLKRKGRERK